MGYPTSVDFGERGGRIPFQTAAALGEFVDSQWQFWSWVGGVSASLFNPSGKLNWTADLWQRFSQLCEEVRGHINRDEPESAVAKIQDYFRDSRALPYSESTDAGLITRVRSAVGLNQAVGVLASVTSNRIDGDDPAQIEGVFLAERSLRAAGGLSRKSVQDSLASMARRASIVQRQSEMAADNLGEKADLLLKRYKARVKRILGSARKARITFATSIESEAQRLRDAVAESVGRIEAVRNTFEQHMRLEAPVKYWRGKAATHRSSALIAMSIGLIYAASAVAIICLWGIWKVISMVEHSVSQTGQWQMVYVVVTIAVFLLTIALWIGRLISRTYISEAHLAIDAEERATMVETYLALTLEGKISDAERVLVLTALFRPSSDGLVRDDGAPDFGIAGLASRAGVGGAAR